jgi:hypothetical protein
MKNLVFIIVGLAGLFCFALTAFMIYADKDNWGWVLFVGILIVGAFSYKSDNQFTQHDLLESFETGRKGVTDWSTFLKEITERKKKEDEKDDD